ncbi:MAG: hypothetical protein GDA39_03440, partial [Hyphomonadaceae bacterium]|nr:hypothetical protein [Hyphomonadaceae bacterium]
MHTRYIYVEDVEQASVREGRIRIRIGLVIFLIAMSLGVFRLAEVSLANNGVNAERGGVSSSKYRADITDRNGEVLATTLNTYVLYARPKFVWNANETATVLHEVFPSLSLDMLKSRLSRNADEVLIKRGLTPVEKERIFLTGEPGLTFKTEPRRFYPRGEVAAHLIGYSDVDMVGIAGAEKAFDAEISPENTPPLALSMDMRVQNVLREELQAGLEKFSARTGAGIVLNIKTGEILAMSSLPGFDPNVPTAKSLQPPRNHAAMSTYELGSVFKPITMAMVLEAGITDLDETFPVQKPLTIRDKSISDDTYSSEPLSMPGIMRESSNRGTALMALRAGGDTQQVFFRDLGLLSRVPYELGESAGPQVQ